MRPFDYLPSQSRTVFRHKKRAAVSPDDGITRFSILSALYLRLRPEALIRSCLYRLKINHSPRSIHD